MHSSCLHSPVLSAFKSKANLFSVESTEKEKAEYCQVNKRRSSEIGVEHSIMVAALKQLDSLHSPGCANIVSLEARTDRATPYFFGP
ncbi:hypothetical protein Peur_009436 [Populus x canadensis]